MIVVDSKSSYKHQSAVKPFKNCSHFVTSAPRKAIDGINKNEVTGRGFDAICREVSVQWQPFVFVAVMVIIILALFMLSGLHVTLPFMTITTNPALPGNIHTGLAAT